MNLPVEAMAAKVTIPYGITTTELKLAKRVDTIHRERLAAIKKRKKAKVTVQRLPTRPKASSNPHTWGRSRQILEENKRLRRRLKTVEGCFFKESVPKEVPGFIRKSTKPRRPQDTLEGQNLRLRERLKNSKPVLSLSKFKSEHKEHRDRMKKMCFFNPQRTLKMHSILKAKQSTPKSSAALVRALKDYHALQDRINHAEVLDSLESEEQARLSALPVNTESNSLRSEHITVRAARIINGSSYLLKATWAGFDSSVKLTMLHMTSTRSLKVSVPRSLLQRLHRCLITEQARLVQPRRVQRRLVRTSILQGVLACVTINRYGHLFLEKQKLQLQS